MDFKFYKLLLILTLALGISACGGDEPADDEPISSIIVGSLESQSGASIAFGQKLITQSYEQTISVINSGNNNVSSMSSLALSAPFAFKGGTYPGTDGTCADALTMGQTCSVVISYSPTDNTEHTDTLSLRYNNQMDMQTLSLALTGKGLNPASLSFNVASVDFGNVIGLENKTLTATIENSGDVAALSMSDSINTPFSFTGVGYPGTLGTCAAVLNAGENCSVEIVFAPTSIESFSEVIEISYDDGIQAQTSSMALTGTGVLPSSPILSGLVDSTLPQKSNSWTWACDQVCDFRYAINQSSTHSFTSEPWGATTDATKSTDTGAYYIHVQARNSNYNAVTSIISSTSFVMDNTDPSDASNLALTQNATETLSATLSWDSAVDETELSHYLLAIGTVSGTANTVGWTNVGDVTSTQLAGSFSNGTEYFTSIQAVDKAGNTSAVVASAAWMPPGPPTAVNNLSVVSSAISELSIGWAEPYHNGLLILDYHIEYKATADTDWIVFNDGVSADTTATVTGLTASTSYDFRVIAFNGSSSLYSNIATGETAPDDPFFEPTFYKAMNLGGATDSQVTALDETTTIELIRAGVTTSLATLNAGEVFGFTSELNDILKADKPIFVAGRKGASGASAGLKGNMVWSSPDWAGKEFIFTATRLAPHLVTVYAFEDSDITVTLGVDIVASQTVLTGQSYTFSLADYGGFKMISTGLIIAHMHSSQSSYVADPKPLLPASLDILGFPSRDVRLTALTDATSFDAYHSNDATTNNTLDEGDAFVINGQGTVDRYKSEALRVKSDKKLVGNSNADYDGYCAAPFVPVGMMKKRYAINVNSQWVAFASLNPGTITVTYPDGTVKTIDFARSGTGPYAPYKARIENALGGFVLDAGTRFESDVRFGAWYEPNGDTNGADEDETIMFGFD